MNHPMTPHGGMDDMRDYAEENQASRFNVSDGGHRIDTHRVIPACSGPCDQGRKACPCPDACESEDDAHVSGAIAWPVFLVIAICAVAAAWHMAGVLA